MTRCALVLPIALLAACQQAGEQSDQPANAVVVTENAADAMTTGGMAHNQMAMTGDVDRDFATMMIDHHKGAITMAQTQLAEGKSPEMRALAERVIEEQRKEIGEMERFLATPDR